MMSRRRRIKQLESRNEDREAARQRMRDNLKRSAQKPEQKNTTKKAADEYTKRQPIEAFRLNQELIEQIKESAELYSSDDQFGTLENVTAIPPYVDLASLMIQASQNKGIYLSFSWPVGFEWVGLSHAIACRALSKENLGDSRLRMALYPAILSNYGRYRNTRFPYQTFLNEAKSAANISLDLSLRHLIYMHLNQAKDVDDHRKNPALANAISLFEWDQENNSWEFYGPGYFSDVSVVLHHHPARTRAQKEQIANYAKTMSDPINASEAVFRVKRNINPAIARKTILDYKGHCDLIVIDARKNLLKGISGWRNVLKTLIEQAAKDEASPSLLLLVDDPSVYKFFYFTLNKLHRDNKKSSLPKKFYKHHWLRRSNYLWRHEEAENPSNESWIDLEAKVTDAQSLFDIGKLNDIATGVTQRVPELSRELRRAAGFLRRLVDMPVGQVILTDWIQECTSSWSETAATSIASRYLWRHYKLQLISRINSTYSEMSTTADKFMEVADSIYERIKESTSIQRETINTLSALSGKSNRPIIIVEEHKYVSLLENAIKSSGKFSDNLTFTIQSKSLLDDYSEFDALILAGFSKDRLQDLLFSENLPSEITLVCDAYSAWSIQLDLILLKNIPEFNSIHSRIDTLLSLIEPQIESFKITGQFFELPTELPIHRQQYEYQYDIQEPYAMIHLTGYGVLPVGEHSSLIKATSGKHSPYYAVNTKDITEGDRILVLGEEQRELISDILKVQGSRLTKDATALLLAYFSLAQKAIKEHYPQRFRTERSRALLLRMAQLDPEILKGVHEGMVLRWMKHIEEFDVGTITMDINELKTTSPRKKKHFIAFARALGFEQIFASNYWDKGIYKLRIGRILEGRQLSNEIMRILTGTMEISELSMSEDDTNMLFDIADKCTYPIEMIITKEDLDEEQR